MQCVGCKREWGEYAWPLEVSYHKAWRYTPIISHDGKSFDYDFDNEDINYGDAEESWYECDQCGEIIYENELIEILNYINRGGLNGNKEVEMS